MLDQRLTRVHPVLEVGAEVQAGRTEHRRVNAADRRLPPSVREIAVVDRFVEQPGLENPAVGFLVVGGEGDAEAPVVIERVGDPRPLHE